MNKRYISFEEFKRNIGKICASIENSGWRPDYVVGITRGGLLPAVMISHYFNCKMHTLDISLRDNSDCESNLWMAEDAYNGKNILVVDDINDQGSTINWLIKDWPSGCFPENEVWNTVWNNNVKFAVVIDNVSSKCNIKMDFCAEKIDKSIQDTWLVFPYEEWNL